jgi:hypothetical protein
MCQIGFRTYENLRFEHNFYQISGLIEPGKGCVTQKKIRANARTTCLIVCRTHIYSSRIPGLTASHQT